MANIKNFYLNTPYNILHAHTHQVFTKDIREDYIIDSIRDNWYAYVEISKAVYSLKGVGLIACHILLKHLAPYGYYHIKHT